MYRLVVKMQHYTRHREKQIADNIKQAFNTMEKDIKAIRDSFP